MKTIRVWLHDGGTLTFSGPYGIVGNQAITYITRSDFSEVHTIITSRIKNIKVGSDEKKRCSCITCNRRT